ncbi:DUF4112 domain-containing protein [Halobaculum sp. WSA2]|uniref:DUF4112 domain-containing protein n=1 Tax=Halobaculum saliterrae TaxID=2073113 RepID=A0A6B0SU54_9EURY|nr:DUF4112 domain-containing protein [Halobaculum saliterrae]MXR42097.1 DUF4112 domain-containing protein [Halobaculum saliterrae]
MASIGVVGSDGGDRSLADRSAESLTATPADARRLGRARRVAHLLDDAVRLPVVGYRVGVDALAGVVPVLGDTLAALLALPVVWEAFRLGARKRTLARMLLYVGLDLLVGSVPIVGDVLDAVVKLNRRNVRLLERDLARRD